MTEILHKDNEIHWFAARMSGADDPVGKCLERDGIRCYRTRYAPGIVFMQCTGQYVSFLITTFWGRVYFYPDAEHKHPAQVPDKEMDNFILVTSASDKLIHLGKVTSEFVSGERVRVKAGLFKGVEGVIKRIKGDRRLVVSLDRFTAVATCYIRPELLEKINL